MTHCPECGSTMPEDAPHGLCPKCLLKAGMDRATAEQPPRMKAPGASKRAAPDPDDLGRQLPQLNIGELIGQGGMGFVYKARQRHLDRDVALKILHSDLQQDPAFAKRFEREARALAKLNHPNIVSVYDSGHTEAGYYYFVMEFVDGVNLRDVLHSGHLEPEKALAIVPQVCEALQYAHERGIVHRDIKPENILLDSHGQVKIADFGLAKLLDPSAQNENLSHEGQRMGTAHYMAPEQVKDATNVDHRADIYSLGVVIYEMLTGGLPIGHFAPPSKTVKLDGRLDKVVLKTLESRPERRYQHASDLKTEIEFITTPWSGRPGKRATSSTTIMGMPLWSVAYGPDIEKGEARGHAHGIFALGEFATGIVAVGLIAAGVFTLAPISVGVVAVGAVAAGGVAMGGVSVGVLSYGAVALGVFVHGLDTLK
jgi:serine/threonine protein kinase